MSEGRVVNVVLKQQYGQVSIIKTFGYLLSMIIVHAQDLANLTGPEYAGIPVSAAIE